MIWFTAIFNGIIFGIGSWLLNEYVFHNPLDYSMVVLVGAGGYAAGMITEYRRKNS